MSDEHKLNTSASSDDGNADFDYFNGDGAAAGSAAYYSSAGAISDERIAEAKKSLAYSERFIKKLGKYERSRLEYQLNIERYRFSAEPGAAEKHEKRMNRRIFASRVHSLKAWAYEHSDNRRYIKAISLDPNDTRLRGAARSEILDKQKAELLSLIEEKSRIDGELSELYAQSNAEYVGEASSKRLLRIRLSAARKAYKKLREVEHDVLKYIFAPDDKLRLFEYMNRSIELYSEFAVLRHKHRRARMGTPERERLRIAIAENRRERSRVDRSISSLVSKARRRTYLYGEGGVWRWVVGISIFAALLIAAFCIFYEPISNFYSRII